MRGFSAVLLLFISIQAWSTTILVVDNFGKPISGASVLIGPEIGKPFANNQLTTNGEGQFEAPKEWSTPLPVSIEAHDIVRSTLLDITPRNSVLKVSRADGDTRIEVQGTMTDYGPLRTDGKVDVGAFIPALPKDQLIYFDIGWMVSPEYDILRVLGRDVAIPSNIALPKQQESYIFPITLDKPNFRMFVRRPGQYKFLAIHGQFPLKRVVDDFRAGVPAYDIVNHGTLLQSGVVNLNVGQKVANLSVPVNTIPFDQQITVQAPAMASDDVILSTALSTIDESGALVPSDVKRLRNGQTQVLKVPMSRAEPQAVSIWLKEKDNNLKRMQLGQVTPEELFNLPFDLIYSAIQKPQAHLSAVDFKQFSLALHSQPGVAPRFLGLIPPPVISGQNIRLTLPSNSDNIQPIGTVVMLSAIRYTGTGDVRTEERTRLWEISSRDWLQSVDLPNLPPINSGGADKLRWEVLYLGQYGANLTHVTRSAVDL
jgi:hypothetical protein